MNLKRVQFGIAALVVAVVLSACSGGRASSTAASSTSTAIPAAAPSPWVALEDLAKSRKAIDYSRLSIGHQGIYALAIVNGRSSAGIKIGDAVLMQWDGESWNDVSARVAEPVIGEYGRKMPGSRVTTYDYTQDGINDFLIEYFEPMSMMRAAGGVLSIGEDKEWHWLQFEMLDGSTSKFVDNLTYNEDTRNLDGDDFMEGRMSTSWRWNSTSQSFRNLGGQIYGD